jgi:halimadienyl-diphosphate synthase
MSRIDEIAQEMLSDMDQGDMGPCTYDAAWVARVKKPGNGACAFPEVFEWLRCAQRPDGSWGSDIEYYPARIISTLAAMVALIEFEPDELAGQQIGRAFDYVLHTWPLLRRVAYDTVGFEILVPTLLEESRRLGLPVADWLPEAHSLRQTKMQHFPPELIYSPRMTLGFSLEFMGDHLDQEQAKALQLANGSICNSVSATAYFCRHTGDEQAYQYLYHVVDVCGPENITYGYPFEVFEKVWVLYNLHIGDMMNNLSPFVKPHLDHIYRACRPEGVGFSAMSPLTDLDDTVVGLNLLHSYGYDVDWSILERYERDAYFQCYPYERDASVSANANVLYALNNCPYKGRHETIDKLITFLRGRQVKGTYWDDKWHISPYYVTSRVIIAAAPHNLDMLENTIRWIENTQNTDGSWGFYDLPTAEETAYCLQALIAYKRQGGPVKDQAIHRGAAFVYQHVADDPASFPSLWISKDLYRPKHIVRSALLGALAMYQDGA